MTALPSAGIQTSEDVRIIRFRIFFIHVMALGVFFVPFNERIALWALASYFVRVFAWEAGSHRYFSHRSYKTSRTFQFMLAMLAAAAGQRGPIWWAASHRAHHRASDTVQDPHSPVHHGFWYAYLGWVLDGANADTDLDQAKDLARFPELVWINKYHYIFPYALLVVIFCVGQYTCALGARGLGLSAVFWIFFLSTLLSLHATFVVNTLTHGIKPGLFNLRRYETGDTTTNNWLLCIPTMGASWHNNHHRFMNSARAGFYWWQLDLAYLSLRFLAAFHIVWELKPVPAHILNESRSATGSSGESAN